MTGARGIGRRAGLAFCLGLAACSTTPPNDSGNLGDPVALTLAPSGIETEDGVLFIANGASNDLRAFLPRTHRFVRAPNSISADVISLELRDANGAVVLPGFGPKVLASGSTAATGRTLGYVIAGGTANRVAVVDAQTFGTTQSAEDAAACALLADAGTPDAGTVDAGTVDAGTVDAGTVDAGTMDAGTVDAGTVDAGTTTDAGNESDAGMEDAGATDAGTVDAGPPGTSAGLSPSCLPAEPLAVFANVVHAYALLAPVNGVQSIAVFTPTSEGPMGAEVAVLTSTPNSTVTLPSGGTYGSLAVDPVGAHAYVGDRKNNQVLDVLLSNGQVTPISTEAPVKGVVLSPSYVNGNSGNMDFPCDLGQCNIGQLIFAILTDGRLQILDSAHDAPTFLPADGGNEKQAPMQFATAVQAVAFASCDFQPNEPPCQLRTASDQLLGPEAMGFAALADGTTVAITPDPQFPQLWTAVNVSSEALAVSDVLPVPGTVSLNIPASSLTLGITRDEVFTLVFEASLPQFYLRSGDLAESADGGTVLLTDPGAHFAEAAATGVVQLGDKVELGAINAPDCTALNTTAFTLIAVNGDTLTLEPVGAPVPCLTAQAQYQVLAALPNAWVLTSNLYSVIGRYPNLGPGNVITVRPTSLIPGSSPPEFYNDLRFLYPAPSTGETMFGGGQAFSFTFTNTTNPAGASISFSTSSDYLPYAVVDPTLSAVGAGLGVSLAATNDLLYIAVVGGNDLSETYLAELTEAYSVIDYH